MKWYWLFVHLLRSRGKALVLSESELPLKCAPRWNVRIEPDVIIEPGTSFGNNVLVRHHAILGYNCSIGSFTEIGHHVKIGRGVRVHSHCFISEFTKILDGAWLGPGVRILNTLHPLCPDAKACLEEDSYCRIWERVIIGAAVTLMPGVNIGAGAVIGAGALVLEDVPSGEVWAGHPAKFIKRREDLRCRTGRRRNPYG